MAGSRVPTPKSVESELLWLLDELCYELTGYHSVVHDVTTMPTR